MNQGQFRVTCIDCGTEYAAFRTNNSHAPVIPVGTIYFKTIRDCPTCQQPRARRAVLTDLYPDAVFPLEHFPVTGLMTVYDECDECDES